MSRADGSRSFDARELLEHAVWVRELARRLVGDAAGAEDLAQDTLVAAIEARPSQGRSLRPWLARVARNLAGTRRVRDRRRIDREEHATSADATEHAASPTAELVARAESQRLLVNEVMALSPDLRDAILWRYFEGLSAAEISRQTGVPAGTIRWRLKEALDRLRERLDRQHDGDRSAWCAALLPLAAARASDVAGGGIAISGTSAGAAAQATGASSVAVAWKGALLMGTGAKVGIGVGTLALVGCLLVLFGGGDDGKGNAIVDGAGSAANVASEEPASSGSGAVDADDAPPVETPSDEGGDDDASSDTSEDPTPEETIAAAAPESFLDVAVFDAKGDPVDAILAVVDAGVTDEDIRTAEPAWDKRYRCGEDGGAKLGPVPPGRYRVVASRSAGPTHVASDVFTLEEGQTWPVRLAFPEGIVLFGRVFEEDRTPRVGGSIHAYCQAEGVSLSGRTDSEGRYELSPVVPGRYVLTSINLPETGKDPAPLTKTATVRRDVDRVEVNLGDEERGDTTLLGRVVRDGAPVAGFLVQMRYLESTRAGMEHWRNTRTDDEGRFTIRGAFAGSAYFNVSRPATRNARGGVPEFFLFEIPDTPEHRFDLVYPDNVVSGRVLDASGDPAASGKLRLGISPRSPFAVDPMLAAKNYQAEVGADGAFSIEDVPAGEYSLLVTATDAESENRSIVVIPDVLVGEGHNDLGDIRLARRTTSVTVRARDDEGRPIAKATVITRSLGVALTSLWALTDSSGQADLGPSVPEGAYTFEVSAKGYAPARVSDFGITGKEVSVDVTLHRGGSIDVTVVDRGGRPLEGARLVLMDPAGRPAPDGQGSRSTTVAFHGQELTDLDGRFHFDRVAPGLYRVRATSREGDRATAEIRVTDRLESTLRLEIP